MENNLLKSLDEMNPELYEEFKNEDFTKLPKEKIEEIINEIPSDDEFELPEGNEDVVEQSQREYAFANANKKLEREKMQEAFAKNYLEMQMLEYQQKYGFCMDGKTKRRARKRINALIKQGKLKMPTEMNLN